MIRKFKRVPVKFYRNNVGKEPVHEVRTNLSDGRISRVLFIVYSGHMILLHGFIKKQEPYLNKIYH